MNDRKIVFADGRTVLVRHVRCFILVKGGEANYQPRGGQ